jgi:hypothetical protein
MNNTSIAEVAIVVTEFKADFKNDLLDNFVRELILTYNCLLQIHGFFIYRLLT